MTTQSFKANVPVSINGTPHTILRKVDDDTWQLEEQSSKRVHEYSINELLSNYANGSLVFLKNKLTNGAIQMLNEDRYLVTVPPELLEEAKRRRAYVIATEGLPATKKIMEPEIKRICEKLDKGKRCPSISTVCRWRKKFLHDDRSIRKLIDQNHRSGNRKSRYPKEVIEFVSNAIDSKFMSLERPTIQDTLDEAMLDVIRENKLRPSNDQLPMPTRRLVTTMIQDIPAFDKCAARYGRDAAIKLFRSVLANRITMNPLERAEIDHTRLDIMAINDETGMPMGRPWLTICIDDFSRCILGVLIGFAPPSYLTVARCLQHAFRPKTDLKEQFPEIANPWLAHGVMRELVVDNGREFHSVALENACLILGIEIHYAPRKKAWFKGKVERIQGTLNRGVAHGHPGTTFSDIFDKGDYDPAKHAIARLSTLIYAVHLWIADYYHQKPHRILKNTPSDVWKNCISPEDIRLPEDPLLLDAIAGKSETRVLTHKGIEFNCLFYNSGELAQLRRIHGDTIEVEIRYNPENIGNIVVMSPDKKDLFKVPAIASEYARDLSLWQHDLIRKYEAQMIKKYNAEGWLQAKRKISELFDTDAAHKKKLVRKNSAKAKAKKAAAQDRGADLLEDDQLQDKEEGRGSLVLLPETPIEIKPIQGNLTKRFAPIFQERTPYAINNEQENSK